MNLDQVVDKLVPGTRQERVASSRDSFLQNAQHPASRFDNGIVRRQRVDRSDESNRGVPSAKQIRDHPDVFGLEVGRVRGERGTKEFKARGPSNVDGPAAAIDEPVPANLDVFAAAFALDGVASGAGEGATRD